MSKSTYPVANDLQAFLTQAGLYDTDQAPDLATKCAAASTAWESDTGFTPFLVASDAAATTRKFDPPAGSSGRVLFLNAGLVSLTTLTVDGDEYTRDADFYLEPSQAEYSGQPFTEVEFFRRVCCDRRGIEITGVWGYATTLKENVWNAILCRAALECFPQVMLDISRGLSRAEVLAGKFQFLESSGQSPLTIAAAQWLSTYTREVRRHKLPTLGG